MKLLSMAALTAFATKTKPITSFCISSQTCRQRLSTVCRFGSSSLQPEFIKSYCLNGTGTKSAVEIQTNTGHTLRTDVPKAMGGSDTAPQPVETLLAALMGCTQATALFVGRRILIPRVVIDRLEFINIQGYRDERGALSMDPEEEGIPSRLQVVEGTIHVYTRDGSRLTDEQMHLLSEQTERRCPVANMMVAGGCEMKVQWKNGV